MTKAKRLPAYNVEEIRRNIKDYATILYDNVGKSMYGAYRDVYVHAHDTGEIDVKRYIEAYEKETLIDVSYKQFIQSMCVYRDMFKSMGNKDGLTIVNKLIGDRKLFSKMRFCSDGSYRNVRIWANVVGSELRFDIRSRGIKPNMDRAKAIQKYIDQVFRSYPVVFIQVPIGTYDEINSRVGWMFDRELSPFY